MLGWSRDQLAKRAGISTTGLANIEGGADCRMSTIRAIKQAMEAYGAIFGDDGSVKFAATAEKIIAAAETARRGGPPLPKPKGLAAQIIAAGKKRRGEIDG